MPSRQYDGLDLINYVSAYISGPTTNPAGFFDPAVVESSQANLTISSSEIDLWTAPPSLGQSCSYAFVYGVSGDFDFDVTPSIPDNALITSVEFKIDASIGIVASGIVLGAGFGGADSAASVNIGGQITIESTTELCPNLTLEGEDLVSNNDPGGGPISASGTVSESDAFSNTQTFDFSGSPITKAALAAAFGSILIKLKLLADGFDENTIAAVVNENNHNGSVSQDTVFTLNNFRMIVTYASGPELVMSPSSGDVEPGQSLNVNGSNAGRMNYAATGVTTVSPIIPKIIDEDTVILPVPLPPTEDCEDCLGDCPECEECFDACNEDLNSENCQQCLDTCLDCLEDCLEELELAEACQQSTQVPTPTPIVIIFGDPTGTQFTGSVPLGTLDVIVANATGIYRLVVGKTNDTLYATVRDGTTYDVAIPIPRAKTGFFRS